MIRGRSSSSQLLAASAGVFATMVALSFVCAMLRPLLPILAAVALVGVIAAAMFRWTLFRWRGW